MAEDQEPQAPAEPEPESVEDLPEEVPEPPPHGRIPPEEPPAEGQRPVTMADLTIYDTLRFMVGLLAQQAWLRLGLQVAPGMAEPAVDLAQARVAIDTLEAIVAKLESNSDEGEQRELHTLLADLRVNYIKKAG
jgi:hypothetical protein